MKKKSFDGNLPAGKLQKFLLFMAFKFFILLISFTGVYATSHAQKKITATFEEAPLADVIDYLKKETSYRFMYKLDLFDGVNVEKLDFKNATIVEVLDKLFLQKGFEYQIVDGLVVIRKSEMPEEELKKIRIKGVVKDEKGEPLPGATVLLKGTILGTSTNKDGKFAMTLSVEKGELIITSVGYKAKTLKFDGNKDLEIKMEQDEQEIGEVVVTGYQTLSKLSQGGAISIVKAEDLILNGTQTLEQALQGQIPGMMVMNQSGLTGTRQRVRVRGTSTLLGNAEPVWVVDGIIQDDPLPFKSNDLMVLDRGDDNMDMIRDFVGSAIAWLNPNDIETITVLKDAASTAIYGVRAANGVIVITTKKGEIGRMAVSYNCNMSYAPRLNYKKMELMNSQQRVDVSREAFEKNLPLTGGNFNFGYTALANAFRRGEINMEEFSMKAKQLETNNTDWFDILFRNAFSHNHNLSVSGGSGRSTYRASFGYSEQNNTAKNNSNVSYRGSASISTELWEKVNFSFSLNGSISETKGYLGANPFSFAISSTRTMPAYNEDGSHFFYNDVGSGFLFNVQNELENSGNKNTTNTLNGSINIRWRITSLLRFGTTVSYNHSNAEGESWYTERSHYIARIREYNYDQYEEGSPQFNASELPMGGELNRMTSSATSWSWRNQLEFVRVLDRHSLTLMVGQEARSSATKSNEQQVYGYLPDRGKIVVPLPETVGSSGNVNSLLRRAPIIKDIKNNSVSYYATLNYMFDNRYAFNASVRGDASNRFGQDKSTRFQPIWAFALRWNAGYEPWLQQQTILSDFSVRFSYGYQGNAVEGVSPDLIATITVQPNVPGYTLKLRDLPAPELKWEKTSSFNMGIDWTLFDHKIRGSFNWFKKKTRDMVSSIEVPFENGVDKRKVNGGSMSNSGWDMSFGFTPLRKKDWSLSCNFNFSSVNNKLKSTIEPNGTWWEATTGNVPKQGYPVTSFWAFKYTGLNPENGAPTFDLSGITDGDAPVTKEYLKDATVYLEHAGKRDPDFSTGISINLRYKFISLSSGLYLSLGSQGFMAPPAKNFKSIPSEYENMSTEWLKRWRKPGDENHTDIPALPNLGYGASIIKLNGDWEVLPYEAYAYSTLRVVDTWFLRCSNINLSCTIPQKLLPSSIKNVGLNVSVSNPFTIRSSDFKGRDPEVALGNQPLSRSITLGVNMSF